MSGVEPSEARLSLDGAPDGIDLSPALFGYRTLARTRTPDCVVALHRRGGRYAISSCDHVLMANEDTGSERALGDLAGRVLAGVARPRVLVGGLGMGFTLRALLDRLPGSGRVVVAELLPAVARWNRDYLGHLSAHPLDDPRVKLRIADVIDLVRQPGVWDAILLDVDNGPDWLVQRRNGALYGHRGLARVIRALRLAGHCILWSAARHLPFERRLTRMRARWRRLHCLSGGQPAGPVLYVVTRRGSQGPATTDVRLSSSRVRCSY